MTEKANNLQEPEELDETARNDGYEAVKHDKDSEKKHKERMCSEYQYENGTHGHRNGIHPSATV
jgi:hypothetical protein